MIDVSANLEVVQAAKKALGTLSNPPMLMVSFPLDEDPHFRKIELLESDCIDCGACLPVCPTQVFSMPQTGLALDTPLCYGCGRCVPACPTDALKLDTFSVYPDLTKVLSDPQVQAVEIHSTHLDASMIPTLFDELGDLLRSKLIALCFRPQCHPLETVLAFIKTVQKQSPFPLIIQVDGEPMSGTDNPEASLPALQAAKELAPHLPANCYLTISGGINQHTAHYLNLPLYKDIQGIGIGTTARQWVWPELNNPQAAYKLADTLVKQFHPEYSKSRIMKTALGAGC